MTALDAESTHVGGGSFRYDKKRRAAKMKDNVDKIRRSRTRIVFDAFVGDYAGPWIVLLIILAFICSLMVWGEQAGKVWVYALVIVVGCSFLLAAWIIPALEKIGKEWNP